MKEISYGPPVGVGRDRTHVVLREPNRSKRSVSELVGNLITPILQPVAEMDRMIASWHVLVDILGPNLGRVSAHRGDLAG